MIFHYTRWDANYIAVIEHGSQHCVFICGQGTVPSCLGDIQSTVFCLFLLFVSNSHYPVCMDWIHLGVLQAKRDIFGMLSVVLSVRFLSDWHELSPFECLLDVQDC